eukprot:gene13980-biopygen6557
MGGVGGRDFRCLPQTPYQEGTAPHQAYAFCGANTKFRDKKGGSTPSGITKDMNPGVTGHWRGRGAGYRQLLAWVARAWRGHGAGVARACPVTRGARHQEHTLHPACVHPSPFLRSSGCVGGSMTVAEAARSG